MIPWILPSFIRQFLYIYLQKQKQINAYIFNQNGKRKDLFLSAAGPIFSLSSSSTDN